MTGRKNEAQLIKRANRAAAVGRLMLGKIQNWEEFLQSDSVDYEKLPRRQLKSAKSDIKSRLKSEIKSFCDKNFQGVNENILSKLYEDIKAFRGLEIPLKNFEKRYGKINPSVLKENPNHLTVCISLWGLQFLFPEDLLKKDLIVSLDILFEAEKELEEYKSKNHCFLVEHRNKIKEAFRKKEFAQRSIILCCFNLMESFLNGIAWDYCQSKNLVKLSNKNNKLLTDNASVSIRDKLIKYPKIISGSESLVEDADIKKFLEIIKPFRDSLVHPSPFSAPEKFGGYNKLKNIYELNVDITIQAVNTLIIIIEKIFKNVYGIQRYPNWLKELKEKIDNRTEKKAANTSLKATSLSLP